MRYRYVVIEREYGSGGTEIGKLLAKKTGIPCYGSEILEAVSKKMQIPVAEIQHYEESAADGLLYTLYAFGNMHDGEPDMLEHRVFLEEQRLIKEYAMQGSAIFVGRCAAGALQSEHVLNVFIHADGAYRTQRIMHDYGIAEQDVSGTMAKFDRKRKQYYAANTGRKWRDWNNYQIVLDSGKLGTELCAALIQAALA